MLIASCFRSLYEPSLNRTGWYQGNYVLFAMSLTIVNHMFSESTHLPPSRDCKTAWLEEDWKIKRWDPQHEDFCRTDSAGLIHRLAARNWVNDGLMQDSHTQLQQGKCFILWWAVIVSSGYQPSAYKQSTDVKINV